MKVEDIEKGMLVTISADIHHTKNAFGWSNHMDKYIRTTQIVKKIKLNNAVNLTNCSSEGFDFNWSAEDLSVAVVHPRKSKRFHFKIQNLDV
jgi:hypothetical protein